MYVYFWIHTILSVQDTSQKSLVINKQFVQLVCVASDVQGDLTLNLEPSVLVYSQYAGGSFSYHHYSNYLLQ